MAYLHSLEIQEAPFLHSQEDILVFMHAHFGLGRRQTLMIDGAFAGSGIATRRSVLPDFSSKYGERTLFVSSAEPLIEARMQLFYKEGKKLIIDAAIKTLKASAVNPEAITHLIVFSCTGMVNPGFENDIIEALQLPNNIETHGIYFAGCHGAFKAIKLAKHLADGVSDSPPNILVCGVELCTLHFRPGESADQIRANTIFSDGSACFIVSGAKPQQLSYQLGPSTQQIIPTPLPLMSWNIGAHAFYMTLSSKVEAALSKIDLHGFVSTIAPNFVGSFVCHPGGRTILETIEKKLQVDYSRAIYSSFKVLEKCGNMSSISILQVLKDEFEVRTEAIVAIGFGPGLTVEGAILTKCN
jgi:predicted naringenin-chalcone synthase